MLLGPERPDMIRFIESFGDEVVHTEDKITIHSLLSSQVEFIVSYGYRHIIKQEVLEKYLYKIINLHVSFLPWNKGADPNLWSFLEDTPKGVTIHYIDSGIDTGDILAQTEVIMSPDDTLRSSYNKLTESIETLFYDTWQKIVKGYLSGSPQMASGNYHRLRDKVQFEFLLSHGLDTPVSNLIGKALPFQGGMLSK